MHSDIRQNVQLKLGGVGRFKGTAPSMLSSRAFHPDLHLLYLSYLSTAPIKLSNSKEKGASAAFGGRQGRQFSSN